jgi:predicted AlkP superfamily pyrophosphatase or phosphodiesterase
MHRTVVLNVVGLTGELLGQHTPALSKLAQAGAVRPLTTITPAVTCSVQASFVTGTLPRDHGIVANGWYFRELAEVWLWRQNNALVNGEKIWDAARKRDPSFTVAKLFWWYNMYSSADFAATPRPIYTADGLKIPDLYTEPASLRDDLQRALGPFPLFNFWGPRADIVSSRWIAHSARHVFDVHKPSLTLVYLPHLDYNLQRLGPDDPRIAQDLREIDQVCGELIEHVQRAGARVIVLSEYGITKVRKVVHINRALREAGLLKVRDELGQDKLDAGGSHAFAVADHQIAHVYVRDPARIPEVRSVLSRLDGVEQVLDRQEQRALGLDHARSGELVALSQHDAWFSYYFWLNDARAPDYARTVDIHRKPGYDPAELFIDPDLRLPMARVGLRLLQKKLGFRSLLDVVPLDASLVKGSHGRVTDHPEQGPLFISSEPALVPDKVHATDVKKLVLDHLFEQPSSVRHASLS